MQLLKLFFAQGDKGGWQIQGMKPVPIEPASTDAGSLYPVRDDIFLAEPQGAGTVRSVLGQSIVPVVAHVPGETVLRCLGTGFFISCTGLLVTAAHVITDPIERQYGGVKEHDDKTWLLGALKLGVMLPLNPLFEGGGYIFRDIEWAGFLAERTKQPLPIRGLDLRLTSDTAICKVSALRKGVPHQPLVMVQSGLIGLGMAVGKRATAIGYAGMQDVELTQEAEKFVSGDFRFNLHVSTGPILERFPDNSATRAVPTPGACFAAEMILPPGMSGSPIFDDERIYVHGVASKGWEDEGGLASLSFGSMLAQSLSVPVKPLGDKTLLELQRSEGHGIPKLSIPDA